MRCEPLFTWKMRTEIAEISSVSTRFFDNYRSLRTKNGSSLAVNETLSDENEHAR